MGVSRQRGRMPTSASAERKEAFSPAPPDVTQRS